MTNHWNAEIGCNRECRATSSQLDLQKREAIAAIAAIRQDNPNET